MAGVAAAVTAAVASLTGTIGNVASSEKEDEAGKASTEKNDLDAAIQKFEVSMFERAVHFMTDTMTNKTGMFAQDSPYSFFASMVGVVLRELGYDSKKGWLSWIPLYSVAYSLFWTMGTFGATRRRVKGAWTSSS